MSGNGRHRRPRQAPALLVAAGVAGSAIAIPLLGASGASAAEASTWDRVAECESGGIWSADLGNGYYGGLQMSQETWDEFGGGEYASRPDLASRSQQIAVAEKVLDAQGARAWSSCAAVSGLTEAVGDIVSGVTETPPSYDAGADPSADPSGAASSAPDDAASPSGDEEPAADGNGVDGGDDAATPSASETPKAGATGSAAGSGADSSPSASDSSASADNRADGADGRAGASTGKHRGKAADESVTGGSDEGRASGGGGGGHASRDAGSGRDTGLGDSVSRDVDRVVTTAGDHLTLSSGGDKVVGGWV